MSITLINHIGRSLEKGIAGLKEAGIAGAVLMLIMLQTADGLLTMWATKQGFPEANPLAAPIASTWLFPLWKISSALLGMMVLIPLARHMPKAAKLGLNVSSTFLAAVLAANLFTLVTYYFPHVLNV